MLHVFAHPYVYVCVIHRTDPKAKSQISKAAPFKKKASLGKREGDRKRVVKKASAVACTNKRPGNLRHISLFTEFVSEYI